MKMIKSCVIFSYIWVFKHSLFHEFGFFWVTCIGNRLWLGRLLISRVLQCSLLVGCGAALCEAKKAGIVAECSCDFKATILHILKFFGSLFGACSKAYSGRKCCLCFFFKKKQKDKEIEVFNLAYYYSS